MKLLKPTSFKRAIFFIIIDIFLSMMTLFLSYNLRFNFHIPQYALVDFFKIFYILIFFKISFFYYFKLYFVSWRFFSFEEAKKVVIAHIIVYSLFLLIKYTFPQLFTLCPLSVIIIDFFLSIIFLLFFRFLKRFIVEGSSDVNLTKTILIGVSPFAQTILKDSRDFYICAIVDDNKMSIGSYFSNIKVQDIKNLEKIIEENSITSAIITKEISQKELINIFNRLKKVNVYDIKILSLHKQNKTLKNLSVEDLLARKPKDLDTGAIENFIKNKTILVTGAGGSIGSEICRQCVKFGAKRLVLLDHSEYNLYKIEQELETENIIPVLQSVVDRKLLEKTFKSHNIDIVIHAAAYKHVPLVEENVEEAILNNIIGTKNVIDLSIKYEIDKVVLISTDKAVRPTNVMGTTKRVCELYAQNVNSDKTKIVAVRFGNVLGSSGSVIPKFKKQIEQGGPITVTHPDITRYFMLIPEACQLVLQAASLGKGRELFILDMGEPVKIVDLAKRMIELSGEDMEIVFTGLRPGEKLYEELLINDSDANTKYDSIMIAKSTDYDIKLLKRQIDELLTSCDKIAKLKEIVPEFNRTEFNENGK